MAMLGCGFRQVDEVSPDGRVPVPVRDPSNFLRNPFGRKNEIDAATVDGALRHVRLSGRIELLGDRDAPDLPYAAQRGRSVSVVARDDNRD